VKGAGKDHESDTMVIQYTHYTEVTE